MDLTEDNKNISDSENKGEENNQTKNSPIGNSGKMDTVKGEKAKDSEEAEYPGGPENAAGFEGNKEEGHNDKIGSKPISTESLNTGEEK